MFLEGSAWLHTEYSTSCFYKMVSGIFHLSYFQDLKWYSVCKEVVQNLTTVDADFQMSPNVEGDGL